MKTSITYNQRNGDTQLIGFLNNSEDLGKEIIRKHAYGHNRSGISSSNKLVDIAEKGGRRYAHLFFIC